MQSPTHREMRAPAVRYDCRSISGTRFATSPDWPCRCDWSSRTMPATGVTGDSNRAEIGLSRRFNEVVHSRLPVLALRTGPIVTPGRTWMSRFPSSGSVSHFHPSHGGFHSWQWESAHSRRVAPASRGTEPAHTRESAGRKPRGGAALVFRLVVRWVVSAVNDCSVGPSRTALAKATRMR
jgi:hypothetical protein